MEPLDLSHQSGRPSIHITATNADAVKCQSYTITCSISSISDITNITWIKTTATGYEIVNVVDVNGKFSGGTLSDPSLTINNIAKSDEGTYVCIAKNRFGTTSSEESVLTCKECFEVEIIQKGPITVGYGATIKINANIISNLTGSLEVNWQKTHNNCSTTLMIDRLKYYGSSCQVNNPQLVINNVNKEDAGIYKLEVISPTETKTSPGILLELHGDEADSLSKEENNFFRLYFLCQKIATKAIRLFFDSKVPGLDSFLKQHKSNLTSQISVYRCTKDQEAKLFPGGQVVVASADFDFTLLYKLIRNLLTAIPAPTCGWGNQPLPGHLNETDGIERIRHLRNNLAHNSDFEICDKDFSTHWTDLSQAIDRLSNGSLSTDVESMRTKSFDKCIKNEMEKDIRKELKEMREELKELQRNFKTRHIPLNIQKCHVELIKKWRIEDTLFYDETGGFSAILDMVKSKNYMTIIGGPGSGKTVTARHIALQLEKQGLEVVPVCRIEEIIQYGDRDHKQVFVLDDVLGIFAVDMNIYNHINNHKEQIFKSIGETSNILFTCRKSVYNEAFKLELFVTENIVDLQSKDNQLTETEKMAICQYHCNSKGVNPDRYTSLSFTKANHMFPFLCKVFSLEEQYQRLGESFFNKPFDYFIKELDKLQLTCTIQYAILVLCLVNGSKLSVECLPPEYMQKDVFNNCGINLGTPDKIIVDAINHMSETYFTELDTEYTFTHDFIFEAIAYHYGRQHQRKILKYLSSSYIANKVTVYEQASNENLCIQISEDMYLPLAERLYTDIQSMNLFDVFMNKSLKHGPFLDVFERMLKTKPFEEFKLLIFRKRQNIRHFVNTTFSVEKHIQQTIDNIANDRLHLLFGRVYNQASGSEHSVRVISWIINYGHTHLLQEIVNYFTHNDHSISLIFGSDVMESTRLLLLACYSNNLDMVELILKYVDPMCINIGLTSSFFGGNVTPLISASTMGNVCIVKALVRNHADIDKCNFLNSSPLITASLHGHIDVVKCLLNSGADISLCDIFGQSPLFVASKYGRCDVAKCLLSSDADINLCDKSGESPLSAASKCGHCDVVKCLLSSGADINLCDILGQSPLFVASKYGRCDVAKCLLSSGADINLCDKSGQSPLSEASKCGHCDVVKCLLSPGADINLCDILGQSPLFVASMYGHCDAIKCLLSSGADINLYDKSGQSPLSAASKRGHCDVAKCLLSSGADINLCDVWEKSPLFEASISGECDAIKCLLSYGADINLCDILGQSPLFVASKKRHCDVIKCLLSSGADINLCDVWGQSPLFVASMSEHCDVIKCLLSSGADINLCDKSGQSPLFLASKKRHCDVVKCLLSSGADINLCNENRESPLFVASSSGHYDIVILLSAQGGLREENVKTQFKTFFKWSNYVEFLAERTTLPNSLLYQEEDEVDDTLSFVMPCWCLTSLRKPELYVDYDGPFLQYIVEKVTGYLEEEISHSKDNQEEVKEAIYLPKVQEGKEETTLTREQEEKEEIIYTRETQKGNDETIGGKKEQTQVEKGETMNIEVKEATAEIPNLTSIVKSIFDFIHSLGVNYHSPMSIAVENDHFDIVKHILENTTDFDLNDTATSPLFLAAENGHYDILVLLLHSRYNDITKTYLGTTPLEIAVWKNKMKVAQLLIQEENKLQKYLGNYHLFEILADLKRSEFCINEQTGKEDCQTQNRIHRHLPYLLWDILTKGDNDCLTHLLKIGLDITKRDYNGNTLLYKLLIRTSLISVYKFKHLMAHFEDVNVGKRKWIALLRIMRVQIRQIEKDERRVIQPDALHCDALSELRKHIRRNSI